MVGGVVYGYVGYCSSTGAGTDVAIGVVEAAGTGVMTGGAEEIFAQAFLAGISTRTGVTSPPWPTEGEAAELVERSEGKSCCVRTSFAFAWLFSRRGHLPRLVSNSKVDRDVDFGAISGLIANSKDLR